MPNMEKISQTRVNFDKFIDYIPVASAINCAVDLVQKKVFAHRVGNNLSTYQRHISNKSIKKCWLYMLPFAKAIDTLRKKIIEKRDQWVHDHGVRSRAPQAEVQNESSSSPYPSLNGSLNENNPLEVHAPTPNSNLKFSVSDSITSSKKSSSKSSTTESTSEDDSEATASASEIEFLEQIIQQMKGQPSNYPLLATIFDRMEKSVKAYALIQELDLYNDMDKDGFEKACFIFRENYIPLLGTPGHERDQEYFDAFVQGAPAEFRDWMIELTKESISEVSEKEENPVRQQIASLLDKMKENISAYKEIVESGLVKQMDFAELEEACLTFKTSYIPQVGTTGHEEDETLFTAFVEAVNRGPDLKSWMLDLLND